jgi:hypothetical protein
MCCESSAPAAQAAEKERIMNKKYNNASRVTKDDLEIPPVSRQAIKRGVMGKYYRDVMANSNVVRIAPDLNEAFPNEASVNEALREVLRFRETLMRISPARFKRKRTA